MKLILLFIFRFFSWSELENPIVCATLELVVNLLLELRRNARCRRGKFVHALKFKLLANSIFAFLAPTKLSMPLTTIYVDEDKPNSVARLSGPPRKSANETEPDLTE